MDPIRLKYAIREGLLTVHAGGERRVIRAVSGGGAGNTSHKPWDPSANDPNSQYLTMTPRGPSHRHGGPLPTGRYRIERLRVLPATKLGASLHPLDAAAMRNRSGMRIHRRGPHGSDGCIVPLDQNDWDWLIAKLRERETLGWWVGELIVVTSETGSLVQAQSRRP
jgi:hypothetical protein